MGEDKPSHLFKKGQRTVGRAKGVPNKATKTIKENLQLFVEQEIEVLMKRKEEMTIAERAKFVCALVGYFVPKKATIEHTKQLEASSELQALTFEQLEQIENIIKGKQPAYQIENGTKS